MKYKTYDTSNGFGSKSEWQDSFQQRMNFKVLSSQEVKDNASIVEPLYKANGSAELKKAYYKLMNLYHPDKAGDTEENKTFSQLINDTYHKLK